MSEDERRGRNEIDDYYDVYSKDIFVREVEQSGSGITTHRASKAQAAFFNHKSKGLM